MNQFLPGATSDLVLSNGVEINFKVGKDVNGNAAVVQISLDFPKSKKIPTGGISAAILREISINKLIETWFETSLVTTLSNKEETILWKFLTKEHPSSGRSGLPEEFYAAIAYFYVRYCQQYPSSPNSELAKKLGVSTKTLSTRLAQARRLEVLTSNRRQRPTGRAGGELTPAAKKLIHQLVQGG